MDEHDIVFVYPVNLGLAIRNCGERRQGYASVARVRREELAIWSVNPGRTDIVSSAQCGEGFFRLLRIIEKQRRNAIGADNLSLGGEVADGRVAKSDLVVGDEGSAGQQKRGDADEHVHPGEFP